jgi:hypothetical protein
MDGCMDRWLDRQTNRYTYRQVDRYIYIYIHTYINTYMLVVRVYTLKAYRGSKVWFHSFLTSTLNEGELSTSRLGRFILGRGHRYPLNRSMGGPQSRSGGFGEKDPLSFAVIRA